MATVFADRLFGELIRQLRSDSTRAWAESPVGGAVIATCTQAMETYLKGERSLRFSYSVGSRQLRTVEMMETIRAELVKLFGPHVSVHRDEGYYLGVIISVNL